MLKSFFTLPPVHAIAAGFILLSQTAHAQQVRLSELLELALTQHPTILQSRSQAKAAGYDLDAAKWGRFPTLSSDVRSDSTYSQSTVRLEQPLWAGGRIDGRVDLGEANLRVADASVREAELNAFTQVGTSFFDLLRLNDRLKSAQDNVNEHQQLLELITRRMEAQISPPADVTLAQARLQQAVSERLQIQRQLESTRNLLTQWAGSLHGEPVAPARLDYKRAPSVSALVDQVLQVSAQRTRLKMQIDSAEAQIRIAQAQALPTVVAGVQHIVSGPNPYNMNRNHGYINLQYQPGAGFSAKAGVSSAVAKKEASERELQALDRSLENQAKSLYSDIDVLQAQLQPAQALLLDTTELVDSYLRQYQIGRKNWLDVLNVLREKTQAQYNLADVRYTLLQSQVKILLLNGEIVGTRNSVIHE